MSGFRDSKATFTPSDNYWFFPPLAHDFDLGKNIHTEGFTLKYFHLVTFFCEWDNWEQYLTRKESVGHPGVRWEVCQEIFMYFQILFLRFNTTWILNPLTKGALSGKRFYWFQLKLDNQNRKLLEGHTSISWNTRQLDFTRNWDYSFPIHVRGLKDLMLLRRQYQKWSIDLIQVESKFHLAFLQNWQDDPKLCTEMWDAQKNQMILNENKIEELVPSDFQIYYTAMGIKTTALNIKTNYRSRKQNWK